MEKRFYFPLTVNICEMDGWGIDWDAADTQDGRTAIRYRNEIEMAFDDYNEGQDMAEYIWDTDSFKSKVSSMLWGFEEIDGCLYGKVDVKFNESLTESEIEDIKDYISGQNSDGLGEGFEQQEIKIPDGIMNVSFWHSGDDYYIYTEEEFKKGEAYRMKCFVFGLNYNPMQELDEVYLTEFKIPADSYNEAVIKLKLLIGSKLAKKCFLNDEYDY